MTTRSLRAPVLTLLAVALAWVGLSLPSRLADLGATAFLRLPVEVPVFLLLVLVLPPRLSRPLAVVLGVLLGLLTVVRILDIGFLESLNRPFDPLVDWRYLRPAAGLLRSSVGDVAAPVALVGLAVLVGALLVLMPLGLLRVADTTVRHRRRALVGTVALALVWGMLAVLGAQAGGARLASTSTSTYAYGQVARIPGEVRDRREFTRAARRDPLRRTPADRLLTGLRGKDVVVVFVESYGRVAVEGPSVSPGVHRVLDRGSRRLRATGFSARSAFLTSPTFGAISWLSHATLQSGLWVDSQQRYDVVVTSPRSTLSEAFRRAGWRTVADVPANTRDWPQSGFYRYEHVYDARNVGYRGPRFGYPTMPDQYTLAAFHRLELARAHRRPVMAEIDLISSHAPWSRTPRMVDWGAIGDGSVFRGMPETLPSEADIWPSPDRVRAAYGRSVEYSLTALLSWVARYGDRDLVVVLLGDHQPATIVSGERAGADVPISVVAKDPAVLRRITSWRWQDGLRPSPSAPVWRMDAFRDRFLDAFGPAR